VHIWRADLSNGGDVVCRLLSSEEHSRARRILNQHRRTLWMRSRGVLRVLLGSYMGLDPRTLSLVTGSHGKPALRVEEQSTANTPSAAARIAPLFFNLSHSGGVALYAFTTSGPVGIDIELARRPIDEVAVARRTFGTAEAERLAGLDPLTREQEFRRAWVRHEAELKRVGTGIGAAAVGGGAAGWLCELDVGPRAAAAVALETQPSELLCWEWR
jgi:4'-phosphopantetheinyl transferase